MQIFQYFVPSLLTKSIPRNKQIIRLAFSTINVFVRHFPFFWLPWMSGGVSRKFLYLIWLFLDDGYAIGILGAFEVHDLSFHTLLYRAFSIHSLISRTPTLLNHLFFISLSFLVLLSFYISPLLSWVQKFFSYIHGYVVFEIISSFEATLGFNILCYFLYCTQFVAFSWIRFFPSKIQTRLF